MFARSQGEFRSQDCQGKNETARHKSRQPGSNPVSTLRIARQLADVAREIDSGTDRARGGTPIWPSHRSQEPTTRTQGQSGPGQTSDRTKLPELAVSVPRAHRIREALPVLPSTGAPRQG